MPEQTPKPELTTTAVALDRAAVTQALMEAGCIAAGEEADELIRAAGGGPRVLDDLVARRTRGEPLAWLTGSVTFCGVELFVAPGVYVPRAQTEPMARRAAALLPTTGTAVDLCTGAGAVAAVLAAAVPGARIFATEIDPRRDLRTAQRRPGVRGLLGRPAAARARARRRRVDRGRALCADGLARLAPA